MDEFSAPVPAHINQQRLLNQILIPLSQGRSVSYQKYSLNQKKLNSWGQIDPGGLVVIEGILSMDKKLYNMYDFTIWVDCDTEVGFSRGVKRDNKKSGVDKTQEWIDIWVPLEQNYIRSQNPKAKADFVVQNSS